jgi:hypothetical protein
VICWCGTILDALGEVTVRNFDELYDCKGITPASNHSDCQNLDNRSFALELFAMYAFRTEKASPSPSTTWLAEAWASVT